MKVALSGMVLGASMLGANASSGVALDGTVAFGSADSLTFQNGQLSISGGGSLECVLAYDKGSAGHYYSVSEVVANQDHSAKTEYKSGSTLAYWCGLTKNNSPLSYTGSGPTQQPDQQRVLVRFTGSAPSCGKSIVSTMVTDGVLGAKAYLPTVASTITYECIEKHDFEAPTVTADVSIKATAVASAIISGDVAEQYQGPALVRSATNGKIFSKTWAAEFDLGIAQPHSYYYEVEPGACNAGAMCFGKLTTKSDDAKHDLATVLSTATWSTDAQVQYFGLESPQGATDACTTDVYISETQTTKFGVCGMVRKTFSGGNGLLTQLKCPFKANSFSTYAAREACVTQGESGDVENTCQVRNTFGSNAYNAPDTLPLENGFSAQLQFPDTENLRHKTADAGMTEPSSQIFSPGTNSLSWSVAVTGDTANADALRVAGSGTTSGAFNAQVSLGEDGKISFRAPADVGSVTLKGRVFTTCSAAEIVLAFVTLPSSQINAIPSGKFEVIGNSCDRRFAFIPSVNVGTDALAVADVYAGVGRNVDVKFCANTDTATDCRTNADSATTTNADRHAIITGACEGIAENHVGGLVRFAPHANGQVYEYAPIKCGGPCTDHGLKDIALDWSVDFSAGVSTADNKFSALQPGARYNNSATDLVKTAYLVNDEDQFGCKADGTMKGAVPSLGKCALIGDNSVTTANAIESLLDDCSGETDGKARLIQLLHVDLTGTGDDLFFCNTKDLSIEIKPMTGTSYDAIAITTSSQESAAKSIFIDFETTGYQECTGGYQLVSSILVDSSEIDGSWTFSQTSDDAVFAGAKTSGKVVFTSICKDVCNGAGFTGQLPIGGTISHANASLDFNVNTQVIGDPCGEDVDVSPGEVLLELYSVPSAGECSSTANTVTRALDDKICAQLTPSLFGQSYLKVTDELLERVPSDMLNADLSFKAGAVPEVIANDFFTHNANLNQGDVATQSDSAQALSLVYDDAFTSYKLTVDWEQVLPQGGGRRLLRSTHIFGAGDHESIASLFILPPSAQVEDAVESLDASTEGEDAEPVAPSPEAEDEGLSGAAIAGIIVGGVAVAGGIVYVAVQALGSGVSLSVGRPKKRDYSQVRRSERFSTMNF